MRIIATCMASNEADIIEAFVRHNLGVLDALVVLDHGSLDRTLAILEQLVAEGLALAILRDPERAFRQGERQTQLARRFLAELDADFCFILDADELVKARSRESLEGALAALPAGSQGLVSLQNYIAAGASADPNPIRRLTRRPREEKSISRKVVVTREFAQQQATQISLGNHAALRIEAGRAVAMPHAPLEDVHLAHFPVRSAQQIAKKALLGWLSHRLTRPEDYVRPGGPEPASHWRALFERIAAGEAVGDELLAEALRGYIPGTSMAEADLVDDPLPCAFDLRYTPEAASSALAALASWADRLVGDINAARAQRTS